MVDDTKVTGNGLAQLPAMPNLHALSLAIEDLDETAVEAVAKWTELRYLYLYGGGELSATAVSRLRALSKLTKLEVNGAQWAEGGLAKLGSLRQLQSLSLRKSKVRLSELVTVVKSGGLKQLNLYDTGLTDDDIQQLRELGTQCEISAATAKDGDGSHP